MNEAATKSIHPLVIQIEQIYHEKDHGFTWRATGHSAQVLSGLSFERAKESPVFSKDGERCIMSKMAYYAAFMRLKGTGHVLLLYSSSGLRKLYL